jgi:hypothetical protein
MNDPVRWLDDSKMAEGVRSVLAAAAPVPPMPESVHVRLVAQCAALAAAGVATQTAAGGLWSKLISASFASSAVKGVVVASLVGAAGTAGYFVFREPGRSTSALHPAAHQIGQARPAPRELPMPPAVGVSTARAADELPVPVASSDAPNASVPRKTKETDTQGESLAVEPTLSVAKPAVAAFDDPTIADEAKLLEIARSALARDPARALQIADRHAQWHPQGQLAAEREFIAVEALLRLDRRQAAWQRAQPWLQRAPNSLYSKRLRELFGNDGQ